MLANILTGLALLALFYAICKYFPIKYFVFFLVYTCFLIAFFNICIIDITGSSNHIIFYKKSLTENSLIEHGDYVLIDRNVLNKKGLPNSEYHLIKMILATPSDVSSNTSEGIVVNKKLQPNTKLMKERVYLMGGMMNDNCYVVVNKHPKSIDSRYFGCVLKDQILKGLIPLI